MDPLHFLVFASASLTMISSSGSFAGGNNNNDNLVLSQLLWRHGDRSPVSLFPTYLQTAAEAWPMDLGRLTQRGIEQHFLLGQRLREKYEGYLSELYLPSEILITASDYDRTIMSAQANLAGLYPPKDWQGWRNGSDQPTLWQPIPVHINDSLLAFHSNCPALAAERLLIANASRLAVENQKANGTLIQEIRSLSQIEDMLHLSDAVYCSQLHDVPLPGWVHWKNVSDYLWYEREVLAPGLYMSSDKFVRLGAGPLLATYLRNMDAKIHRNSTQKMFIYSAHDTTVMGLLAALGVFEHHQPPYASTLFVELYRKSEAPESSVDESDYEVVVKYLKGRPHPRLDLTKTLVIPECTERCPLDRFKHLVGDALPYDRDAECKAGLEGPLTRVQRLEYLVRGLTLALAISLALLFFSCVFFLVRQRRTRARDYLRFHFRSDNEARPLATSVDEDE